jgi:hypothetical protein
MEAVMAAFGSPARACGFLMLLSAGAFQGAVQAAPSFKIDRLALHQFEDGTLLDRDYEFLPGETAFFSCRLDNYAVDENDEQHRKVKLAWKMEVRDSAGVLLVEPAQGRIDTELLKEDTDWLPKFLKSFIVPGFALSGEYRITVRVHDEVADSEVAGELKFRVKGHAVEPSGALAVRNFAFLTSEDDPLGMRQPIYHPGGMGWARMDVTGYKFGENNRFSVVFGMALEDSQGKPLFTQPEAGGAASESFYPQRYAPGTLTLNLDQDVTPGTYTLLITVRDEIGNQRVELRQPFRVQ